MARIASWFVFATVLVGCNGSPCENEDGDKIDSCFYGDEELEFCPGDQWSDGCQSCGCSAGGEVICTISEC